MKPVELIRRSLERIPRALEDEKRPAPPQFGEVHLGAHRADMLELEPSPDDPSEPDTLGSPSDVFRSLDQSVASSGIEALAWYHPFHSSAQDWGIYIPTTSLHYCSERWFNPRMAKSKRISLALKVLIDHEIIHFACEYMVAQVELLIAAPCWTAARQQLEKAGLKWFWDEEALANANSIRNLLVLEKAATVKGVRQAFLRCPPGYRDFERALSDAGFTDHILEVLRHNCGIPALDLKVDLLDPAIRTEVFFPPLTDALGTCPVYLIGDSHRYNLPRLVPKYIDRINYLVETKRFQRMLKKLHVRVRDEWEDAKAELAMRVPAYPKFKKLTGELQHFWGLHLSDGFRVHLRPATRSSWEAVEIGNHKAMGHG